MGREVDLSLAFREFGLGKMAPRVSGNTLFINAHPKETFSETFIASLERLRNVSPEVSIVVEIHESAVTDVHQLRTLANRLLLTRHPLRLRRFWRRSGAPAGTRRRSGAFRQVRPVADSRHPQGERTQASGRPRPGADGSGDRLGAARRRRGRRRGGAGLRRNGLRS
jgi:hypothetical protein